MFCCCTKKTHRKERVADEILSSQQTGSQLKNIINFEEKNNQEDIYNTTSHSYDKKYQEILNMVHKVKGLRLEQKLQLSINIEKSYIQSLIDLDLPTNYFIDFKWATLYTQFLDGKSLVLPKTIDNTTLLANIKDQNLEIIVQEPSDLRLKKNIKLEKHYVLLNERSWQFVHLLYNGGPSILVDLTDFPQNQEINQQKNKEEINSINLTQNLEVFENGSPQTFDPTKTTVSSVNIFNDINLTNEKIQQNCFDKELLPIIGLKNRKCYCYMNVALQFLMSILPFNEEIRKKQIISQTEIENNKFIFAYQKFLNNIINLNNGQSINASTIQDAYISKFCQTKQQDAHEFLLYFLTTIQEELIGNKRFDIINNLRKEQFLNAQEAWEIYKQRNPDIINQLFSGQIVSKYHCLKCKTIIYGYDPIWDLQLPLCKQYNTNEIQLDDCLNSYFKQEKIIDEWKCEKCHSINETMIRSYQMTQTPQYLLLQLKRFTQFPKNKKITDDIFYPNNLNLKQYCSDDVLKTEYKLKGIISHFGQLNGGHYISYVERNEQWYQFDDEKIYIDKNNKHQTESSAYIFLYQQM